MMEILEQTSAYLVCVKPVGIPSQGEAAGAMPVLLRSECDGEIYPVHRLDQAVGGVMVYARTKQAAAALSAAIQSGQLVKEYLAILTAVPAEQAGRLRDLLYHDQFKNKTYVVNRKRNGVKEAILDYETLAIRDGKALVRVRLRTGRTHQIRVQFASRGCPLAGDGKYGGKGSVPALWAFRLTIPDPETGELRTFSACPPGERWAAYDSALTTLFPPAESQG